jgi:glycerophosphoryl diester phosphodiesterase
MKILGHRGKWYHPKEKNSLEALKLCLESGFGIETDIRDHQGEIVISHDPPMGKIILLSDFLKFAQGKNLILALNIKSDGLSAKLKTLLDNFKIEEYFTFDMSIPELIKQTDHGLKVFTGVSDINPNPILINNCQGIWLDGFFSDWYSNKEIEYFLSHDKKICLVSPELHNRNHLLQWKTLKESNLHRNENVILCTDYPEQAKIFFDYD